MRLALDDFGIGYSSLAYLKHLPVKTIKIDRSFVRDLGQDPDALALVRAIVMLGHSLRKRVVAEGVENATQLEPPARARLRRGARLPHRAPDGRRAARASARNQRQWISTWRRSAIGKRRRLAGRATALPLALSCGNGGMACHRCP